MIKQASDWIKVRFWPFATGGAAGFLTTKFDLLSLVLGWL